MERVKGIEPSYSAWKAAALPLSYTRVRRAFHRNPAAKSMRRAQGPRPRSAASALIVFARKNTATNCSTAIDSGPMVLPTSP